MEHTTSKESQEMEQKTAKDSHKKPAAYILKTMLAGGIAGSCAKTVVAPLDRVKLLFQTSHPDYIAYSKTWKGAVHAALDIQVKEGVAGLFKGHSVTLLRIFPYAAIKYMVRSY